MSSDGEGSKGEASGGDLRVVYGAPPKCKSKVMF